MPFDQCILVVNSLYAIFIRDRFSVFLFFGNKLGRLVIINIRLRIPLQGKQFTQLVDKVLLVLWKHIDHCSHGLLHIGHFAFAVSFRSHDLSL